MAQETYPEVYWSYSFITSSPAAKSLRKEQQTAVNEKKPCF